MNATLNASLNRTLDAHSRGPRLGTSQTQPWAVDFMTVIQCAVQLLHGCSSWVLWHNLGRLAHAVGDTLWLVGDEFNTVLDMSEVCGASGEWFTWHNCSSDNRSLWKRLDQLLVNDRWLDCWPNSCYASLNARTSDHSPFVLRASSSSQAKVAFLETAQTLLSLDRRSSLLLHLEHCCRMIPRLVAMPDQSMLQQQAKLAWLKGGDQCTHIFFRKVVFDIVEDKAPGPDGFSSGFFKAAWPVVGMEVTKAVLEFFATGKLLKQVNATLLSLIPRYGLQPWWASSGRSPAVTFCIRARWHWPIGLFQLGFADDLLLFSKADVPSITIFKRGLSPLLTFRDSMLIDRRVTSFCLDRLLHHLSVSDCRPLLLKIDNRIKGWDGILLSFAGRVQLIMSALIALHVY
ncbi:UNVERIFIED_CONTAM: hypothetical protein Slati_4425200 [Sesamum latifolium]|uniref:Reverse transcriptase n=1 Tax=Sesamum latifolium TaxID=2727402 RepID=A0AAW2SR45_9LAMI